MFLMITVQNLTECPSNTPALQVCIAIDYIAEQLLELQSQQLCRNKYNV